MRFDEYLVPKEGFETIVSILFTGDGKTGGTKPENVGRGQQKTKKTEKKEKSKRGSKSSTSIKRVLKPLKDLLKV